MAPMPLKRSTPPSQGEDGGTDEPISKRRCVEPTLPRTPPPEEDLDVITPTKISMFDDDPHRLLLRSVALTLEHVGFTAASPEALEAVCAEVDTYAAHFLSKVTSSMFNARRSQPTPVDFKYALAEFNLPIASIEPHLRPPVPASRLHIQLDALPFEEVTTDPGLQLLGEELSGEPDKKQKTYIPKRFPSFPSKHTYKWTEKESARETDPRKIREEAAKAARQGEEALRRLTKVGKAGKERDVKKAASKDPRSKVRHGMWEKAVDNLMVGTLDSASRAPGEEDDRSMVVNADRPYLRKGAPAKRKAMPLEIQ